MKTALLIDGSNLYTYAYERKVDFKKMLEWAGIYGRIVTARYYTPLTDAAEYNALHKMADWLSYNGFIVISKTFKNFTDGTKKCDLDAEIIVDAMELAPYIDQLILVSGDGDFTAMVQAVQRKGVRVTVLNHIPNTASELRKQADTFIELDDIYETIKRDGAAHDHA